MSSTKIIVLVSLVIIFLVVAGVGAWLLFRSTKTSSTLAPGTAPSARSGTASTTSTSPTVTVAATSPTYDCKRVPVYRMASGEHGHMDSMVPNEGSTQGFVADGGGDPNFYACSNQAAGTIPVYRGQLSKGTDDKLNGLHMTALDSVDFTKNQFTMENYANPVFYAYKSSVVGSTPIYRRGNATNSDRILTKYATEGDPEYTTENGGPIFHAFTGPT